MCCSGSRLSHNHQRKWQILFSCLLLLLLVAVVQGTVVEEEDVDQSSKYMVVIRESIDEHDKNKYDSSMVIPMTISDDSYHCFLPTPPRQANNKTNQVKSEEEKQRQLSQFIANFKTQCYLRMTGWWTYEFCFSSHVKQYHQEAKTAAVTVEYILGRYKQSAATTAVVFSTHLSSNPEESYVSQLFEDGTVCDLTQTPRRTEVRIYCATDEKRQALVSNAAYPFAGTLNNFLGDVEEPQSCSYIIKFYSADLCHHEGFAKADEILHKIQCIRSGNNAKKDSDQLVDSSEQEDNNNNDDIQH